MDNVILVLVAIGTPVLIIAIAVPVIIGISRARRLGVRADSAFVGAPLAHGVVVDRDFLFLKVANRRKYRLTYQVCTPEGQQFVGWEDVYLSVQQQRQFAVGSAHPVAYLPGGQTSEVRGLPGPPPPPPIPGSHGSGRQMPPPGPAGLR